MRREQFVVAVLGLASLTGLGAVTMVANAQSRNRTQDRATSIEGTRIAWEYARLVVGDDLVVWHAGETNVVPETLTIDVLYRRMGGNFQPNLTNLLTRIGSDGWELVMTDESVWTFKRRR
jgi:hypothetical protein